MRPPLRYLGIRLGVGMWNAQVCGEIGNGKDGKDGQSGASPKSNLEQLPQALSIRPASFNKIFGNIPTDCVLMCFYVWLSVCVLLPEPWVASGSLL